jgi:hypothetical protein
MPLGLSACATTLFTAVIYAVIMTASLFVPGSHFHPSFIFVSPATDCPFNSSTLCLGSCLLTNIRQGWKWLMIDIKISLLLSHLATLLLLYMFRDLCLQLPLSHLLTSNSLKMKYTYLFKS